MEMPAKSFYFLGCKKTGAIAFSQQTFVQAGGKGEKEEGGTLDKMQIWKGRREDEIPFPPPEKERTFHPLLLLRCRLRLILSDGRLQRGRRITFPKSCIHRPSQRQPGRATVLLRSEPEKKALLPPTFRV